MGISMMEKNMDTFKRIKNLTVLEKRFIYNHVEYEMHIHGFINKLLWSLDSFLYPFVIMIMYIFIHDTKATGWQVFIPYAIYCVIIILAINTIVKEYIRKKLYFSKHDCISIDIYKKL